MQKAEDFILSRHVQFLSKDFNEDEAHTTTD